MPFRCHTVHTRSVAVLSLLQVVPEPALLMRVAGEARGRAWATERLVAFCHYCLRYVPLFLHLISVFLRARCRYTPFSVLLFCCDGVCWYLCVTAVPLWSDALLLEVVAMPPGYTSAWEYYVLCCAFWLEYCILLPVRYSLINGNSCYLRVCLISARLRYCRCILTTCCCSSVLSVCLLFCSAVCVLVVRYTAHLYLLLPRVHYLGDGCVRPGATYLEQFMQQVRAAVTYLYPVSLFKTTCHPGVPGG